MPVSVLIRCSPLRVAVAVADADTFRRIPEQGTPTISVFHSAEDPSRVLLPIAHR
jgi:hypothetical protein